MNNVDVSSVPRLKLSRAELYVLVRLLKATSIPGIDLTWFQTPPADLSPEVLARTVDAAVKALVARDYLVPLQAESTLPQAFTTRTDLASSQQDWKKVGIPEAIVTLLEACTFARQSLSLTWQTSGNVKLLWLHAREQCVIAVTSPLPEIYQFTALPDWDASVNIILDVLGLKEQQAPLHSLPAGKLQTDALAEAREAIEKDDPARGLFRLTSGGLPESTAQSFLEAINSCTAIANLVITRQGGDPDKSQQQAKLVTVVTPTTCFVLRPLSAAEAAYSVRAVPAAEIRTWLTAAWSQY
jgi:hypothetical protein